MKRRPKVLLLIPHLGGGGAERVVENLAKGLDREKYELHLGLVTQSDAGSVRLPEGLTVHPLRARRVRHGAFPILRLVWKLKPHLILSGIVHLNLLVLMLRPLFPAHTRILIRQSCAVSATFAIGAKSGHASVLHRALYNLADRVISQSQSMADELHSSMNLPQEKVAVVCNPVDVEGIRATADSARNHCFGASPRILATGRLSSEKGFDLLLIAFASIRELFPSADLTIAGSGPEELKLRAQCLSLGINASVRFLGDVGSTAAYFPAASLFVLPSRCEGMPNALLEAGAGGLPIVALPASGGLVDLLHGQEGVWLAHEISAQALSTSILEALSCLQIGQRFPHSWIKPFELEFAIATYAKLIDEIISS